MVARAMNQIGLDEKLFVVNFANFWFDIISKIKRTNDSIFQLYHSPTVF